MLGIIFYILAVEMCIESIHDLIFYLTHHFVIHFFVYGEWMIFFERHHQLISTMQKHFLQTEIEVL